MYALEDVLIKEFIEKNEITIQSMKEDIRKRDLCFVLGAGVSQSVGFPNWQTLLAEMIGRLLYVYNGKWDRWGGVSYPSLEKLYQSALKCEEEHFVNGCKGEYVKCLNGINLLELAEYLLNRHIDSLPHNNNEVKRGLAEKQIASLVHACLYKDEEELGKILQEKRQKGKLLTLDAITHVIAEKFSEEKKRQDILTYNYDNLLEYNLASNANPDRKCPIIESGNIKSISYADDDKRLEENKINICHIHGKVNVTDFDKNSERLILSESSYHEIEDVAYKWIHTVQANAMFNSTCLFVGFSAEDYNFRRIIRKAEKTDQNYIFFAIDDFVKAVYGDVIQSQNMSNIDVFKNKYRYEKLMLNFLVDSRTRYWEKQNIKPIWTTLAELPDRIMKL